MNGSTDSIKISAPEKTEKSTMEKAKSLPIDVLDPRVERAAQDIDPETAEVKWEYRPFGDPYGVSQDNDSTVIRQYFARSPRSDIWVSWNDLPYETEMRLWEKHKQSDPGLCEPTSCWSAFVHSRHFREDDDRPGVNANHVRYVRLCAFGKLQGE